jgi:hypothetical protein
MRVLAFLASVLVVSESDNFFWRPTEPHRVIVRYGLLIFADVMRNVHRAFSSSS